MCHVKGDHFKKERLVFQVSSFRGHVCIQGCMCICIIYIYIIFLFAYCKQWVKELLQGSCCGLWILLVGGPTKSTFSKGRAIHNSQHHCLAMHLPQFISLPPQQKLFKVLGKPFGKPKKQQTKLWFSNYSDLWTS